MTLIAEHQGTTGRIVQDRPDVGWYLYISLPTGQSRDHLQDTKEIAVSQAEEEYGIPSSAWLITEQIHIYLKDEGVNVWRPVDAIRLDDDLYKIPDDTLVPDDEDWQFLPGTVVRCVAKELSGGFRLVAIEAQKQSKTEQDAP
jgi:hypothetical protein